MKQRQEHGLPGHLNAYVRDEDSSLTNYGLHNRLLVFFDPATGSITCREDVRHDLPFSDEEDRQRCMNADRHHPLGTKLQHVRSNRLKGVIGDCIWHEYAVVPARGTSPVPVVTVTCAAGDFHLSPVPLPRMPSKAPSDWIKFQGNHVPRAELDSKQSDLLVKFMLEHKTEALTNGKHFFTMAGQGLAYCKPEVIN